MEWDVLKNSYLWRCWAREWAFIGQAYAIESLLNPEFKLEPEPPRKKRKPRQKSKARCKPADFVKALKKSKKIYDKSSIQWPIVGQRLSNGKLSLEDARLIAEYLDASDWISETKPVMDIVKQVYTWADRARAWDNDRKKGQPQMDYSAARR